MSIILTSDSQSAKKTILRHAQRIHGDKNLEHCSNLADLLKNIPILDKSGLRANLEKFNWINSSLVYSETSGTTNMPLPTPRGKEDLHWNAFNQASAYRRFLSPGNDRVAILHPAILSPFVEASVMALHMLNIGHVKIFPVPNVCDYQRLRDVVDRYSITTIMSTPSLVYKLFYEFTRHRGSIPCSLKKILLTGEPLSTASIKNLCRVINPSDADILVTPFVYGSSEIATTMYGREDGTFEPILEDFIFELHKDSSCHEGHRLIVSWLREGIMPILRYDTNDYFYLKNSKNIPLLKFLGRAPFDDLSHDIERKIENAVYSLPEPVYHFGCVYSTRQKMVSISITTATHAKETCKTLEEKISEKMQDWQITVDTVDHKDKFFDFSPKPKINKFQRL